MKRIYLDNNASTFIDPKVLEVLKQELELSQGNPSSSHFFGQELKKKLANARSTIAAAFNIKPSEIYFTSGATESANLIIRGLLDLSKPIHAVTTSIEHDAVYKTFKDLEKKGLKVSYVKPEKSGAVSLEAIKREVNQNTALIAVMAANNETGVINPIQSIAEFSESLKIPFFVDATQIIGKAAFTLHEGITAFCMSGHKIHGPKGIGMAFIRKKTPFSPLISGGEQEFGKRGGTENSAAIVALAAAFTRLQESEGAIDRMSYLRDLFEKEILHRLKEVYINGGTPRICNTSNLYFKGVDGEALLTSLDLQGIAASHGSACSSGALKPSRVLLEMGLEEKMARSSLRFSLSRFTEENEIREAIQIICSLVENFRSFSKS